MDEAYKNKLWNEYAATKSSEVREQLILEYAPLVKLVAGRLSMYLGYNVEYDDLVSYGIFGLIDAIDKFDSMKEVKFETYASLRIRGSILDQIRKMDWIPRTIRQKQKKIDAAMKEIETTTGRAATDEEIAQEETAKAIDNIALTRSQWRVVVGNDARAETLESAEKGGTDAVQQFLQELGWRAEPQSKKETRDGKEGNP